MLDLVDLSLILPAFNERASIGNTVDEAFAYFRSRGIHAQIIVAADGTDGTRKLVGGMTSRYPDLDIIGHEARAGKGRGVREAVALARGRVIGYADADNKVPVADFDRIQPWLASFPIVIGSRALALSQIERWQPWYRRLGSKGFSHVMQTIVGVPGIGDTQCGFKFFQRDAALHLFKLQQIDGYMFDVELLALAIRLGYCIKEVPIRWRDDADSRYNLVTGTLRNLGELMKIRTSVSRLRDCAIVERSVSTGRSE
jgi:dolichyl-phosphate beta-glucosyltransferase